MDSGMVRCSWCPRRLRREVSVGPDRGASEGARNLRGRHQVTEIQLDKLTADDLQTCDWGYCDGQAVAVRLDTSPTAPWDVWLSVCARHSTEESTREGDDQ